MDKAYVIVDRELIDLEKELSEFYANQKDNLIKEFDEYMKQTNKEINDLLDKALDANVKGDEFDRLYDKYEKALKDQTLNSEKYKAMIDSTTTKFADINQQAADKINAKMPSMYSTGYNAVEDTASSMGVRFDIVNERAVKRMSERGDVHLPARKINIPKDKRWNTKQMNSAVLQGIIDGESIDKISKRLLPIVDNNRNSAIRAARTMTTEAENCGRLDSYKELQDKGVVLKKVWEATDDDRTRESHKDIDGEEQDVDKKFSNGCMYPADGDGPADEVWMCRCTMTVDIVGFKRDDGSINYLDKPSGENDFSFDEQKWLDSFKSNEESYFRERSKIWINKLTDAELDGVVTYTSNAYTEMNGYLRGSKRYKTTKYEKQIDECQKALMKNHMEKDVIVTRGGGKRGLSGVLQDEKAYDRIISGDTDWVEGLLTKDKGFMSTTPLPTGGYDVQYFIKVPKGANAAYVEEITRYHGEYELLLAKDSRFYIHKAKYQNDTVYVFMSML